MRNTLSCVALLLACAAVPAAAQSPADEAAGAQRSESEGWYYESGQMKLDPLQVHMQKSAQRAAQRNARIAAMNWYGMSNARPTASATPFTGMYSPAWQMPGGRPFAWRPHTYTSTVYIVR